MLTQTRSSVRATMAAGLLAMALLATAGGAARAGEHDGSPSGDVRDGQAETQVGHEELLEMAPESQTVAGKTRYETAAEAATQRFESSEIVVIASGQEFPDALSGSTLAGLVNAPILLVPAALVEDGLPSAVTDAIDQLGATQAVLLGGNSAISPSVERFLRDETGIEQTGRLAGDTRYETAEAIANQVKAVDDNAGGIARPDEWPGDLPSPATVAFLATGQEFPDSLAAGPGAFAGTHPVFLTTTDELHPAAARGLETFEADVVVILGGNAAVSEDVQAELEDEGYVTHRLGGENRYQTAVEVAEALELLFGFDPSDVGIATGGEFPDALGAAPYLGTIDAPVVLTARDTLAPGGEEATRDYLEERSSRIEVLHFFGGTNAISESAREHAMVAATPGGTGILDDLLGLLD